MPSINVIEAFKPKNVGNIYINFRESAQIMHKSTYFLL